MLHLRRSDAEPGSPPEPPAPLPPARTVQVPGVGELFLRDTGGDGPPLLLLHGWMVTADLNWFPVYDALRDAGYRVLAPDHRGHGRGIRCSRPFRLEDCARDAAALVRELGCGPVTAVGYSMGGPIAELLARDHPDTVRALVLCATATDWQSAWQKAFWRGMGALRLGLGLFPTRAWEVLLDLSKAPKGPRRAWVAAELSRGSSVDLAEAGRELSRYDARPWLGSLRVPAAVVVTSRDRSVPPRKQRALAQALEAPQFDVPADHLAVTLVPEQFRDALLAALRAVAGEAGRPAARAQVA